MVTEGKSLRGFVVIALAVTVIWALLGLVAYFLFSNWEARGTFGDMFGSINVLFSGLALGAVVYTIHLQQQDLKIQRDVQRIQLEDLKIQSQAAVSSAEQLAVQQQLLNYQISQETVINLINIKNKFVENFQYYEGDQLKYNKIVPDYTTGLDGFYKYYKTTKELGGAQLNLNVYFDTYFFILQFITDSNLSEKQKEILANILTIQTTDVEIFVMCDEYINSNNQHRLALLKKYKLMDRYNFIKR
ncbi:hypothetical protein [Enterobacter ludwigii]|uniref:hypothetical protein n=1 Tax=Enterobacter ludwigii TaxID=299767 RepID=UPI003F702FBD